jgi:hypothetical protein
MTNLKTNRNGKLVLMISLILLSCFSIHPVIANPVKQKKIITFDTPLKAFEGIYHAKENESVAYQVTVAGDKLTAKLIDGQEQLTLTRKSDLTFEFKDDDGDQTSTVVFTKSDAGEISQAIVNGKELWIKAKNNVQAKGVKLSPAQLKAFEGKYKFQFEENKDVFLQITATADGLVLKQLWDGKEINFTATSDVDFLNSDIPFPLKFTKDANGAVIKVLAFNRDLWDKVKE